MKADSLGDRMKDYYEGRSRHYLTRRTPVIMRLDGKAFHTFTRGCTKPFDDKIIRSMQLTALACFKHIQGTKLAYVQSDEISILITDYDKLETDAWFDYNIQKMCSISAAVASVTFTKAYNEYAMIAASMKEAYFDSRVFNIPKEEVSNYFLWRFNDWVRNSVSMLAQAHFSHKELHCKSQADMHEMLYEKLINWNNLDDVYKNGTWIYKSASTDSIIAVNHSIKDGEMRQIFFEMLGF